MKKKRKLSVKQLQEKAPRGEFLAYISPQEAKVLKALGGSGKKINGIPSFFASSPGDTGGAGGDDGAGGNDAGGGSTDTGDMGSEAANAASTAAGAASVGVGSVGPTDPGIATESITSFGDTLATNIKSLGAKMALPGATAYAALKTMADVNKARKAMGLSSKQTSTSTNPSSESSTKGIPSIEPSQPLMPENKVPFQKMNFVRASKGTMVSKRGTKSIQVRGFKKTKIY